MFGLKERSYPAHVLISFWCDSDNKNFFKNIFLRFRILADISVLLILAIQSKFSNIVIQLKCYLLGMLTGPEKIVRRMFFFFQQNARWLINHMLLSRA